MGGVAVGWRRSTCIGMPVPGLSVTRSFNVGSKAGRNRTRTASRPSQPCMPDLYGNIDDLESEIERLSDEAERCRKAMVVARAACIAGGLMLLLTVLGQVGPAAFVFAVAAILGGIALFGSSRTTRAEIISSIEAREAQRAEMINRLELREVGG